MQGSERSLKEARSLQQRGARSGLCLVVWLMVVPPKSWRDFVEIGVTSLSLPTCRRRSIAERSSYLLREGRGESPLPCSSPPLRRKGAIARGGPHNAPNQLGRTERDGGWVWPSPIGSLGF